MITAADLKSQTVKDLTAMARKMGLSGIHSMRKDELVRAVAKAARTTSTSTGTSGKRSPAASRRSSNMKATAKGNRARSQNGAQSQNVRVLRKMRQVSAEQEKMKDLSQSCTVVKPKSDGRSRKRTRTTSLAPGKDRIVLLVRDPYWLQACWEISRQTVLRAQAAMAAQWHVATPVLRLIEVEKGATTSSAERVVREMTVHGGVKNWYIDVKDSPKSFRVELGYLVENGRFHSMVRSNTVTTPAPGSSDAIDENWTDIAENYEKIYAMSGGYTEDESGGDLRELFEERLRRPMHKPSAHQFNAEQALRRNRDFNFHVDAEMIVYGASKPDAHVTLAGDPVRLRPDGSFTVRLSMPDRRQVLPIVAHSRDGVEERTVVLAVERNTKVMEPLVHEAHE